MLACKLDVKSNNNDEKKENNIGAVLTVSGIASSFGSDNNDIVSSI